jgi:hypothetical protein
MRFHHITRTAALAAAITALTAPSALAGPIDLSSPDARDAAAGRGTFNSPDVTVLKVAQEPAAPSNGIDWVDVGIGAGGALGIAAIGAGGGALLVRRPRRRAAALH